MPDKDVPIFRNRIKRHVRIRAGELVPHESNWRTHPTPQVEAMRGIYEEIGVARSLLAYETPDGRLKLIDGHLRRDLAPDMEVDVEVLDVDESEAKKILATLDPLAAMATADAAKLDALLREVDTGSEALQQMLAGLTESAGEGGGEGGSTPGGGGDEFEAEVEEAGPTRSRLGDLWAIGGKHRLLVGDCTESENVARLMGGKTVGLCFTSPPYAQQRDYGEAAKEKVQDWYALMCGAFAHLPMDPAGQVLVNLGLIHREGEWVPYWDGWIEWMREQGWRRFGWYVWDKLAGMPGDWNGRLAPAHEFIWHFNRTPVRPAKTTECKNAGRVVHARSRGVDGELRVHTGDGDAVQSHKIADSVIRCGAAKGQQTEHPAPFPVALPSAIMESWPSDVYDPFLGSGTTLIAAHRLNRCCFGCEIDPRYADVILRRAEAEGLTCEKVEV